jgi:SCY1-like protein 2
MAALSVFREVGKIADIDFTAIEVLPILWSFSLGPLLNLQQVSLNSSSKISF